MFAILFLAQSTSTSSGGGILGLLPLIAIFGAMYFLLLRPQRKRQKEHANLVEALGKGDEVVMTSGMLGKITKLEGDYVVLEVSNNLELKFQKSAVHAVLPKGTIKAI